MIYEILTLEKVHIASLNKDKLDCTVKDLIGVVTEKVSVWQDFPDFETITFNSKVEGDIVTKTNGQYTNLTLYPPRKAKTGVPSGYMGAGGAKLMEKKMAGIEKSQDRKEEGIKHSSCIRMAHETALAQVGGLGFNSEEFKTTFAYWHNFYQGKWEEPFN